MRNVMKPGKYAGHNFTKDQEQARRLWERARKYQIEISDALHVISFSESRERLHERLDQRLNTIDKTKARALELFADVGESFTVASMTIQL